MNSINNNVERIQFGNKKELITWNLLSLKKSKMENI